jgi:hypothetical protein
MSFFHRPISFSPCVIVAPAHLAAYSIHIKLSSWLGFIDFPFFLRYPPTAVATPFRAAIRPNPPHYTAAPAPLWHIVFAAMPAQLRLVFGDDAGAWEYIQNVLGGDPVIASFGFHAPL